MKEKIIEILKRVCALEEEITQDSELATLSIDSLSFVSAMVEIESEFDITFDVDELNMYDWKTASELIRAVEEKTNGKK